MTSVCQSVWYYIGWTFGRLSGLFFGRNNSNNSSKKRDEIAAVSKYESPDISANKLPLVYRSEIHENWNGIKVEFCFQPTQLFSVDYSFLVKKGRKKYNFNSMGANCFLPLSANNSSGLLLLGKKEPVEASNFQGHLIFSEKDKITFVSQTKKKVKERKEEKNAGEIPGAFGEENEAEGLVAHPFVGSLLKFEGENGASGGKYKKGSLKKRDNNCRDILYTKRISGLIEKTDNVYSVEYTHEFNSSNISLKYSNTESPSLSYMTSLYKNFFFGIELFKEKNQNKLKCNYSLYLKNQGRPPGIKNLGFSLTYLNLIPGVVFNANWNLHANLRLNFNSVYNKNSLIQRLGKDKFNWSLNTIHRTKKYELNSEINKKFNVKFFGAFSLNNYLNLTMNFSFDPNPFSLKNKFKQYGIGVSFRTPTVEERVNEEIIDEINE